MVQICLLCLILLANSFVGSAMAPAPSPQSPSVRKFDIGKHQSKTSRSFNSKNMMAISPTGSPKSPKETIKSIDQVTHNEATHEEDLNVDDHKTHLEKHHHRSVDKSVAGGGVILGGLATTFLVVIGCYIRATRRHKTSEDGHSNV